MTKKIKTFEVGLTDDETIKVKASYMLNCPDGTIEFWKEHEDSKKDEIIAVIKEFIYIAELD